MTQLQVSKVWKDPFSPEEIAKTEPENGFNSFADALIKAAKQKSESSCARRNHLINLVKERN